MERRLRWMGGVWLGVSYKEREGRKGEGRDTELVEEGVYATGYDKTISLARMGAPI
jgi:hypothetical protein